jgi:hypothetical protein
MVRMLKIENENNGGDMIKNNKTCDLISGQVVFVAEKRLK